MVNANGVATAMGSIPASSDTVESERGASDKAVLMTVLKKIKNKAQNLKKNYGSSAVNKENRRADIMSSLYLLF